MRNGHRVVAVMAAGCLCILSLGTTQAAALSTFAADASPHYIVRVRSPQVLDGTVAAARRNGTVGKVWRRALNGFVASLSDAEVSRLRSDPDVASVEPDSLIEAATDQSNPPWGLDRVDQPSLPLDHDYSYHSTGSGVTVYLVDSGIRTTHAEFAGRILPGWSMDFGDGTGVEDCNGHGTHVAGIVGGTTYGVAKDAWLVPVKVLPCYGGTLVSTVLAGLDWIIADHAAGRPAVANMSIGGSESPALDAAVQAVIADGVTVVVAAGNDAINTCTGSPGRVPAAITVGASESDDWIAGYSDYGPCNDLFAPGTSIQSAWDTSDSAKATMSGTSMAAPHVTGAVARLLQASPRESPAQVWAELDAAATKGALTATFGGDPNKLLRIPLGSGDTPSKESEQRDDTPGFTPVAPTRLLDTRPSEPQGAITVIQTRHGGPDQLSVRVAGAVGVPQVGVGAVSLNVTVVDPVAAGFVTVYPCGDRPLTSSLNYTTGEVVPNAVIAPVSADGQICFYSSVDVHLVVDVNGWFATGAGFAVLAPTRLFDTRAGEPQGAVTVTKQQYGELRVRVAGAAGVPPTGAAAVSLNVTVANPVATGFVTVYPCGDRPLVSSLNYAAGQIIPNAVIAPLSADGEICLYSSTGADLVADVNGWFAAGSGFTTVSPTRVFDTREGAPQGAISIEKQQMESLRVKIGGAAGVPQSGVSAVSLNVTVVDPVGAGFVTVYPCGERPLTSSLNYRAGQIIPNAVIAPLSPDGEVCFYSSAGADLVADVNGWYAAS